MNIQRKDQMNQSNSMMMSFEKPSFIENSPEANGYNDSFSCLSEMNILSPYRNFANSKSKE